MIKAELLGGRADGLEVEIPLGEGRIEVRYVDGAKKETDAIPGTIRLYDHEHPSVSYLQYKVSHYSDDGSRVFMVPA